MALASLTLSSCSYGTQKPLDAEGKAFMTEMMEEHCIKEHKNFTDKSEALCKCFAKPYVDESDKVDTNPNMTEKQRDEHMELYARKLLADCAKSEGIDQSLVNRRRVR